MYLRWPKLQIILWFSDYLWEFVKNLSGTILFSKQKIIPIFWMFFFVNIFFYKKNRYRKYLNSIFEAVCPWSFVVYSLFHLYAHMLSINSCFHSLKTHIELKSKTRQFEMKQWTFFPLKKMLNLAMLNNLQ